jgi:hypothetical protein
MATAPMNPDDESMEAPEGAGAEQAEGEGDGTYYIEVACHPDGSFTVSKESAESEASESGEAGEAAGQEFSSAKEAVTAVLALMKGSQMQSKTDESSQMAAGFKGASL